MSLIRHLFSRAVGSLRSRLLSATARTNELEARWQAAEAKLAAKTRSIALTSHDLRTPLNGILGMTDLLGHTSLTPEQASYIQAISTSATALLSLVDGMLDAGKIAAGRWLLKPQPIALESLVEEVVELLAPRAQEKGLELAAHVTRQIPASVSGDPDQLTRILTNLMGNAIKFTDHGGVALELSVEQESRGTVTLAFRVRDSGVGIAAADQARIFEDYEQAKSIGTRPAGTGLGLAISRQIARAMGGDITVKSTPGEGSTFCLKLDLPVLQPPTRRVRPFDGHHILLISDRTIEPPLLMRRLFDLGASVELARTVEDAIGIVSTSRVVDAILFDHGGSLDAAAFKAVVAGLAAPPIAVMLAPQDRRALDRIRASGIEAYLVKPMRTASLEKVVSALFAGRSIAPSADDRQPSDVSPEENAGLRLLFVDDNEINVLLGSSLLKSLGQSSDTATDGADAIARAAEASRLGRPYDVILMDLHMPDIDGFDAISAIRDAEKAGTHRAFIVALTADILEETARTAIEAGADLAAIKPIPRRELADILAKARTSGAQPARIA